MARITLDIPDNRLARVIDAFTATYGYEAQVARDDGTLGPNPETPQQFTRRRVGEYVRQIVTAHEAGKAGELARQAAVDKAVAEITVT